MSDDGSSEFEEEEESLESGGMFIFYSFSKQNEINCAYYGLLSKIYYMPFQIERSVMQGAVHRMSLLVLLPKVSSFLHTDKCIHCIEVNGVCLL